MCHGVLVGLCAMGIALTGCRRESPPEMLSCPSLTLGAWQWVGVVGPPGSVEPFDRVELFEEGGEVLWDGARFATADGSFAIRGARLSASPRRDLRLRTSSGRTFSIRPGRSDAYIDYDPDTYAVIEETPNVMQFRGELAPTQAATAITRAWAVNWSTGAVAPIDPTPPLGVTFDHARIPGTYGQCMGIFSEHASGRTGGCWWATPGGCLCRRRPCPPAELVAGTCVDEPIDDGADDPSLGCHCQYPPPPASTPGGNGREPLPARERHDPPPPSGGGRSGPPPPHGRGDGTGAVPETPAYTPPDAGYTSPYDPSTIDAGPVEPPS